MKRTRLAIARMRSTLAATGRPPGLRATAASGMLAPAALIAAATCLVAGLSLPIMHVRWLVFFDHKVSVLSGIRALLENGEFLLAAILFVFSVAFPLVKIALLLVLWSALRRGRPPPGRLLMLLEAIGRWSMLDVFVLALVIFAVQAQPLADAQTAGALLPFLAAILLTSYGARLLQGARR